MIDRKGRGTYNGNAALDVRRSVEVLDLGDEHLARVSGENFDEVVAVLEATEVVLEFLVRGGANELGQVVLLRGVEGAEAGEEPVEVGVEEP